MSSERYRLFFALWPEPELAGHIRKNVTKALSGCDGKRLADSSYHITLAFYGSADAKQLACLQQVAETIRGPSFQLTFDKLGYWPRPKVVWLAPTELPETLLNLQSTLSQKMADNCGYQAEKRPYRPHLTLTRKTKHASNLADIVPIVWQINQFVLVRSITRPEGAEYQMLKQWRLG